MEISCWPSQPINEAIAALMQAGVLFADDAARILGVTAIRTYGDLCTFAARGELETIGMEPLAITNLCTALGVSAPAVVENETKRGGKRKGDGA